VATQIRSRVTRSGKVLGSDSGKESSKVSDNGLGKNSSKEAGQDKEIYLLWDQSELKEDI
jgi:hypothetical protein